jgi:hypothetical protein
MDENRIASTQSGVDVLECRIDDLLWDVSRIWCIHKIENKVVTSSCNEIFRMIYWGGATLITQCLPMVRLFAGMNYAPSRLVPDVLFVI